MHRIDTSTAQEDKFGAGKNGFTNGDPATGRRATDLNSDMWDALQEELCAVIEKAGITLDKQQHDQLYKAIVSLVAGNVHSDALLKENNLSDVKDVALSRENLSVYSCAESDNKYLLKENNLSDVKDVAWSRENLSVYSRAESDNKYLLKENNLSDVKDVAWSRENLSVYSRAESDKKYLLTTGGTVDGNLEVVQTTTSQGLVITGNYFVEKRGVQTDAATNTRNTDGYRIKGFSDMFVDMYHYELIGERHYLGIHVAGGGGDAWYQFGSDGIFRASGGVQLAENVFISREGQEHVYQGNGDIVETYGADSIFRPFGAKSLSGALANIKNGLVTDIGLGTEGSFVIDGSWQQAPGGCVLTGYRTEGQNPGGDTIFYRPVQKYIPSMGWVTIGNIA